MPKDKHQPKHDTKSRQKPKKPPGPPPLTLHIDDTPENVAKSLFGIKSDTPGKVTMKRS
ncbi:MAG: hypothetical protein OXI34_14120 [Chloroflexota bacterium]|nr:hypothetical protein [Chloroflexota bacterium]MDE2947906.1 hypothetical protein [Chloroflexota bacterium]